MGPYAAAPATAAWEMSFTLAEAAPGSYLAIALKGTHGVEGACAALRVDGGPVGAPDRSVSHPSNVWEHVVRQVDSNYTYYVPVTADMIGRRIDAVAMVLQGGRNEFVPEVWLTACPPPHTARELVLT